MDLSRVEDKTFLSSDCLILRRDLSIIGRNKKIQKRIRYIFYAAALTSCREMRTSVLLCE